MQISFTKLYIYKYSYIYCTNYYYYTEAYNSADEASSEALIPNFQTSMLSLYFPTLFRSSPRLR